MNQKRESNFELLRIISMFLIVVNHFCVHTGFLFSENQLTINQLYIQFIQMGGKLGVVAFVLISGYFLIDSSKVKISKILKLWGQVFFYSVIIYIIFIVFKLEKFTIVGLIKNIIPLISARWWFATTYFVLYLFTPYINIFLKKLDRQTYKKLLILMTICWVIIPTFTTLSFESNSLIYFVYLYSLAGYIKLWKNDIKIKSSKCFAITILGLKYNVFKTHVTYFYDLQKIPVFLMSLFLFIGFKNLKVRYNKVINTISMATFGVYLIHDNPLTRAFTWKKLLPSTSLIDSVCFIPYSILVVLTVYIICTIIEWLRIYLIEKYYMKLVNKYEPKIDSIIQRIYNLPLIKNL